MKNKAKFLALIQKAFEVYSQGILLVVKLLNEYELSVLLENDADIVIDKFYSLVERSCIDLKNYQIIKEEARPKLYIVIPNDPHLAQQLAYSIYSQIQLYVDDSFSEAYLQCSVGSIRFDIEQEPSASKVISLLAYSMCMNQDKNYYYSYYYYSYDDHQVNSEQLRLENQSFNILRSALLQRRTKFAYQPIIDRQTGQILYYECLLRAMDAQGNYSSVGPMILTAELKGLINIVDFTVVEMVIDELLNDPSIKLSINISNIGLLNKKLLYKIETLLKKYDIGSRLIIEITETSLNQDFHTTQTFIHRLHNYGCRFALDDFGSGFTSFKQLLNLPIDIIKIDGMYIRDILSNNLSRFFVEALINLAMNLDIKTVAEFVENSDIAQCLIDLKIGGMQGNFFMPASEKRLRLDQTKLFWCK